MSERRIQQVLFMVASYWAPLKSEELMSCIFLGFEIPHVEYLMAVQVVVPMVPWIAELALTWVGDWYLQLWFPIWVPLQHELNTRNVKCVSDIYVIRPLQSGLRIWILFCARVLWNSTRKVVQHLLDMDVEMKYDVSLPCLYLLLSPTLTAWT